MNSYQKEQLLRQIEKIEPVNPCKECEHFNSNVKHCSLYDAEPPENFQIKGCDQWVVAVPF